MASGGCGRAATECFIPPHACTTVVADLRDHVVRPMQWRERRSGLRRCREGQGKSDSDQSDHLAYSSIDLLGGTRRLIELDEIRRQKRTLFAWVPGGTSAPRCHGVG